MELNYFISVKQPQVVKNVPVEWWLNEIKNGYTYRKEIETARKIGKGNTGYNEIKTSLPCVTWNFKYQRHKSDCNLLDSTGFFYYDIDDTSFKIDQIDKSKIYSAFSSLSNQGVSIIVKVSGATAHNFDGYYLSVAKEIGIEKYLDPGAFKKSQFTVLTYDNNAFLNQDAVVFTPPSGCEGLKSAKNELVPLAHNKRAAGHIGANDTFFRYNNLDAYSIPNDVVVNQEGFEVISLYLPSEINVGKRKHTLLSFCNNLVLLNPAKTEEEVFHHIMGRNENRCTKPLSGNEVMGIVKSIFRYKEQGTLAPKELKSRKILFGKNCGMDKQDKMSFAAHQVAEWKKNKTKTKIYDAIVHSESKVTQSSVQKVTGISLRTVKRYWAEYKELVKEKNKSIDGI